MKVFVLEHHVVAILAPGGILSCAAPSDLFAGFRIFQLIALGFHQQDFSAAGHNDKIRVMVAERIQAECKASAVRIPVPPLYVLDARQGHCHLVLEAIQFAFLFIKALCKCRSLAGQGDVSIACEGLTEVT